jgi:hypothetical protein
MRYTLLLESQTVGTLTADTVSEGDAVTVNLQDENGNPITETGTVSEILETSEHQPPRPGSPGI